MDEGKCADQQKQPSVEMFVTTAAKQDELLKYCSRTIEIVRTEKDPGNAYRIDRNRPCKPAHRPRRPLKTLGKSGPLAMDEEREAM